MITEPITSEMPEVHWGVLGEHLGGWVGFHTVLDLGCGWHDEAAYNELGLLYSTPWYWTIDLDHRVIGVDCNESHISILRHEVEHDQFIHANVTADLVSALMQVVSYIKCDIEGAESELFRVPVTGNIHGVAVECHTADLLAECRLWCRDGGLTIIAEQPLAAHPRIVVVTAVRVDA